MKYDMAGGATMLGAMRAIGSTEAEAQGDWNCFVATENMPSRKRRSRGCADCDVRQGD